MEGQNTILRFIKTAFTFFVGNVSTKLISFLLIPIYTVALEPAEYGGYDLIVSILNLIAPLAFFQIWDGVFRFSFDKNSLEHKTFIINNGLVISAFGIVVLLFFNSFLKIVYPDYITKWVTLYGICYALQYFYTVIARVYLNNVLFSVSGVINALIAALLNIFMIKWCGMGVDSLYIAASIGIIVQIVMIEIKFRPLHKFRINSIDVACIKEMISFSFPLCISTIAYWMLNGYSKILISNKCGVYDNGLYAVANKFTSLILIVVSVVQFAWNEMVYMVTDNTEKTKIYETGIRFIFSATMLSASIFLFIVRLIFPHIVDENYAGSLNLIPISMVGVAMNSFASFSGTLFLANKKSSIMLTTTFFAVGTNIILSLLLVSKFYLYGVLVALSIALTVLAASRLIALYYKYQITLGCTNYFSIIVLLCSITLYYTYQSISFDLLIMTMRFY